MTDAVVIAYATYPDAEEARRAARLVVEERLAACVHIRPHESVYRWRGEVEEAAEALVSSALPLAPLTNPQPWNKNRARAISLLRPLTLLETPNLLSICVG